MPGKHAKLSASGAERWMNCPKSVALESHFDEETSVFAEEGTLAHAWVERLLRARIFSTLSDEEVLRECEAEMSYYVKDFADFIMEFYKRVSSTGANTAILLEERLGFSHIVPGGFGTGDVVVICGDLLAVVDFKYGKGVTVSAIDNPQLRLYALGALKKLGSVYPIKRIQTAIYQPRLNNKSIESLTKKELEKWAREIVKPKAQLANKDKGDFAPGKWCKFCKARRVCRARATTNIKLIERITKGELL